MNPKYMRGCVNCKIDEPALRTETGGSSGAEPSKGNWPSGCIRDPITGLVAFPEFHKIFPSEFWCQLKAGHSVGIAIGDVDDLKKYVEKSNHTNPLLFGHLAGNWLMTKLGVVALEWFSTWDLPWGVLSTFGGDEIILASSGLSMCSFDASVETLAINLSNALPCTVSFACGWFEANDEVVLDKDCFYEHYLRALGIVDRALFQRKSQRDERRKSQRDERWSPHPTWAPPRRLTSEGWIPFTNVD